jgi:hypothetical protein
MYLESIFPTILKISESGFSVIRSQRYSSSVLIFLLAFMFRTYVWLSTSPGLPLFPPQYHRLHLPDLPLRYRHKHPNTLLVRLAGEACPDRYRQPIPSERSEGTLYLHPSLNATLPNQSTNTRPAASSKPVRKNLDFPLQLYIFIGNGLNTLPSRLPLDV